MQLTNEQLRHHYEVETELADQLRKASKAERRDLYPRLYDELCRRVPFHPMLQRKYQDESDREDLHRQYRILSKYLGQGSTLLEVGPGDCRFSLFVSPHVKAVYGVDVSIEFAQQKNVPSNFKLMISDGSSIPVEPGSIDVAYSNQLMEHLHPEDAVDQLRNIVRSLKQGGKYVCLTPHRFSGPHDVSRYFDDIAKGFHLKEYTYAELYHLFLDAGFSRLRALVGVKAGYVSIPASLVLPVEKQLDRLPRPAQRRFAQLAGVRNFFLNIKLVATK